jgi:hypothetical protein
VSTRTVGYWPFRATASVGPIVTRQEKYVPPEAIDSSWDAEERAFVIAYLKAGEVRTRWRGISGCAICHCHNGSTDLTDGEWVWPQGYAHYLEKHGVKPPAEFIEHVLSKARK